MATFNPGTDGSVIATTLENQFYTIITQVHGVQGDAAKNPNNAADILNSSIDIDGLELTGDLTLYLNFSYGDGSTTIALPDPYINAGWIEGTGGDGNATNYNHALYERAVNLISLERDNSDVPELRFTTPVINILDSTTITPIAHNATFNCSFRLELEIIPSNNGSTYRAKEYLS